jgi:hypothetical protein
MPRKPPQVQTTKQGAEAIFMGPCLVTFVAGAILIVAMGFDRWYMTSRTNDISRYGLFRACSFDDCQDNVLSIGAGAGTSCPDSGSDWMARSTASAALLAIGLAAMFVALVANAAAAITRNMVYFFYNVVLLWFALVLIVAGGTVQYHLFASVLFCGQSYCAFARERYGTTDARFCAEAWGMSVYLWFVAMCVLGVNALGTSALTFVWRQRLAATWKMRGARPTYAGAIVPTNNNKNNNNANNRNDDADQEEMVQRNVPEGYVWDEQSGYFFSKEIGWYFDSVTQQYYDPSRDLWYDPINQIWQ